MLKSNRSLRSYIGILLLSLINPTVSFCGIEAVPGLNIQKIATQLGHHGKGSSVPPSKYLDELLATCELRGTHLCYEVETYLQEGDSNNSEDDSEMTNTDLESIDVERAIESKGERGTGEKSMLFALNVKPGKNDSRKKYLLRASEVDTAKDSLTEDLCTKLTRDACHIANADKNAFTRNATTCLCVVLRDEASNAKKFVFHNGQDKMSATMAQKAQDLKYAIRTGSKAHAEAEFIQFLLQRKEQNKERYTHILGMGCSRRHCKECDSLLQLFLGKPYCMFTAATKNEENHLPIISDTEKGCVIRPEIDAPVVYESDAVNKFGNRSEKYYLPQILQDHINQKIGLNIDFAADRFVIKDEGTMVERRQRSDKKRRVATLPLS